MVRMYNTLKYDLCKLNLSGELEVEFLDSLMDFCDDSDWYGIGNRSFISYHNW